MKQLRRQKTLLPLTAVLLILLVGGGMIGGLMGRVIVSGLPAGSTYGSALLPLALVASAMVWQIVSNLKREPKRPAEAQIEVNDPQMTKTSRLEKRTALIFVPLMAALSAAGGFTLGLLESPSTAWLAAFAFGGMGIVFGAVAFAAVKWTATRRRDTTVSPGADN